LVANPPYVDPAHPERLADDVRRFEPAVALFTPARQPGVPYDEIAAGVAAHMAPGAWIIVETGVGADSAAVAAFERERGVHGVELLPDFAGLSRYVRARVRES
jgi:release factor glutamine methyltransferase